jgi:hypothetical protein
VAWVRETDTILVAVRSEEQSIAGYRLINIFDIPSALAAEQAVDGVHSVAYTRGIPYRVELLQNLVFSRQK